MRIGIDARLAGTQHAGIGRYIEELVKELVSLSGVHTWVIFVSQKNQLPWLVPSKHVEVRYVPVRHYTLREQLILPFVFARARLNLLHIPHFNVPILYPGNMVVTIHDLLWHQKKERNATTLSPFQHAIKYQAYRIISQLGMARAKAIIVPTQTVKRDVEKFRDASHIHVISEGVHPLYFSVKQQKKREYPFPYLIYTGSLYPHKNVEIVLKALRDFPTLHFLVVGSRDVFVEAFTHRVEQEQLQDRVHMLGYVEDKRLARLYNQSVAVVQPSLSEGFGLTGIEAMAAGAPVIASDITVLREVYGDVAFFFDPYQVASLRQCIKKCLTNPKERERVTVLGKKHALQYSWKEAAQKTVEIYTACQ